VTELTTVIPVFNGERFLPATLACLAAQTRPADRIVVIDNGSTDSTPEIVRNAPGLRCEFRRNESNLGVLGNLNRCLALSRETRHLHLLMADDLVTPEFNASMLEAMKLLPGPGLGYCFNETISQTGAVLGKNQQRPTGPAVRVSLNEFLGPQSELATVLLPGVIFKTEFQDPVCLFRDMPQVADGLFLAEWAAKSGGVVELPQFYCQYRVHPFNASSRHMYDLKCFVEDEWEVSWSVFNWFQESAFAHARRALRLRLLHAARMQVKIDMMDHLRPDFADTIRKRRRELVGTPATALGWTVVRLRDALRLLNGRPGRAEELISNAHVAP
jgi:glycosyltransferase involved in cell wall biosynthesis